MTLGKFLASLRTVERTDYGYIGRRENSATPFGAYGMVMENWESWSAAAGLRGMDYRDPSAQDAVAGFTAQKLFQRYGSWDLVAAAWYTGQRDTDRAASSNQDTTWFKNPNTRNFLTKFKEAFDSLPDDQPVPTAAGKWVTPQGAPRGWLNPIAGQSEYSNSFTVPRDNKWGIHGAIDVYSQRGTAIVVPVGGKVLAAKTEKGKGGNWVQIQGDDGLTYYFAHMNEAPLVTSGQRVTAGTGIGFVGDSGSAKGTKPHLHFAVKKNGKPINPYNYLQGAKNSENYYVPSDTAREMPAPSTTDRLGAFVNAISSQVAGGERVDYRTLGNPQEEIEGEGSPLLDGGEKEPI